MSNILKKLKGGLSLNKSFNKKKILVIGAGPLQVKTIKLINEMGFYSLCVDGNENAPGFKYADDYRNIDVVDKEKCLEYALEMQIDAITTTSATITLPAVGYIAKHMNLVGISADITDILWNKYKMKNKMVTCGLNTYGFFSDVSSPEILSRIREQIPYPSILKPSDGSGSKGVIVVKDDSELEDAITYSLNKSRINEIYIEEFIEGREFGVESFVCDGVIYIFSIIDKIYKFDEDGNLEYGHSLPAQLDSSDWMRMESEVKKAIECLGINFGSVNMDLILSREGVPYIIDLGARIGLCNIAEKLIPYSTGVNILENTLKAALGDESDFGTKLKKPISSRMLILKSGIVKSIDDYSYLYNNPYVIEIVLNIKKGDFLLGHSRRSDDFVSEFSGKTNVCGWVITSGETIESAIETSNNVRKELYKLITIE